MKNTSKNCFKYNFNYLALGVYILTFESEPISLRFIDSILLNNLQDIFNIKTFNISTSNEPVFSCASKTVVYCVGRRKTKKVLEYIHSYEMSIELCK